MQQPPNWQQPHTQYPPQPGYPPEPWQQPSMPMMPPPPPQPVQSPPKKSRKKLWLTIAGVVLVMAMCGGIMNALGIGGSTSQSTQTATSVATTASTPQSTNTPVPTAKPTQAPKWTTTQTFTGSGIKKTGTFSVPDDWKLTWTCKPSSFYGGQYNVQVYVYNSDGSIADVAINDMCKSGNTAGETEEHQSGDVYLEINSEGAWTIQVQALK